MAQRLVRCIEGHVYDSAVHECCPTSGANAGDTAKIEETRTDKTDETTPRKLEKNDGAATWPKPAVLVAAAAAVLLIGGGISAFVMLKPRPNPAASNAAASTSEEQQKGLAEIGRAHV